MQNQESQDFFDSSDLCMHKQESQNNIQSSALLMQNQESEDIIKSDINEMNIDHSLSCVLINNFSNKIVSKLSFEDKIDYIVNVIRKRIHKSTPIFILTGSNALKTKDFSEALKKSLRSDFIVTKIQTPFFDTNRYLLEIRYV